MEKVPPTSDAQAIIDVTQRGTKTDVITLATGETFLSVPDGRGSRTLTDTRELTDEFLETPRFKQGDYTLEDLASFIALTNRFKDEESAVFASLNGTVIKTVFDFNKRGEGGPRHGKHVATYNFPLSNEWIVWMKANGQDLDQANFAAFVEKYICDVADPGSAGERARAISERLGKAFASPNQILTLAAGLSLRINSKFQNIQNTSTGECTMSFVEAHNDEAGAPLKVPGMFLITIPVFKNGSPYQIAARLLYRVRSGQVTWQIQLQQPEVMIEHAFNEACTKAGEETALPVFRGHP